MNQHKWIGKWFRTLLAITMVFALGMGQIVQAEGTRNEKNTTIIEKASRINIANSSDHSSKSFAAPAHQANEKGNLPITSGEVTDSSGDSITNNDTGTNRDTNSDQPNLTSDQPTQSQDTTLQPGDSELPQQTPSIELLKKTKIKHVEATNGSITIELSSAPADEPKQEDFDLQMKYNLFSNWKSLDITTFNWDAETLRVTATFEPIVIEEGEQIVQIRVTAYGSTKTAKPFTVEGTHAKVFAVLIENRAPDNILEPNSPNDSSLSLKAIPIDKKGKPIEGKSVEWSSSDKRVADVNNAGTVTAKSPGVAIIQAKVENRIAIFPVLVKSPGASLSLIPDTLHEAEKDDGSVAEKLQVELKNGLFLPFVTKSHVQITGLPEGLDYQVKQESEKRLSIQFKGKAIAHDASDSKDSLQVVIKKEVVLGAKEKLVSPPFAIKFQGPKDTTAPQLQTATLDEKYKRITLRFNENLHLAQSDSNVKTAIQLSRNGIDYLALGELDRAEISGNELIIDLERPLRGTENKVKLAASMLQDEAGNLITEEVITGALVALSPGIADAKERVGEIVTLSGIVTADNSAIGGGKLSTYLQDETAGINLFSFNLAGYPDLREGDEVEVTGMITIYRNLTEIVPSQSSDVIVKSQGNPLPEPTLITVADINNPTVAELKEGKVVTTRAYLLSVPEGEAGGGYNLSMIDEEFRGVTVRVMKESMDTTALQPGKWYDVTGILSQYNDLYQILPRKADDFTLLIDQPQPPTPDESYNAVVKKVVDGDTIQLAEPVLGITSVRFVYIDTPETYHITDPAFDHTKVYSGTDADSMNKNQKAHGERAKLHLQQLISPGDEIILKPAVTPIDGYGRLLAEVIRKNDESNLNLKQVQDGFAGMYMIAPVSDERFTLYSQAVHQAMQSEIGIWNRTDLLTEEPFVFRAREQKKALARPVGDVTSKKYVQPLDYHLVSHQNRLFFQTEEEAVAAGYTKDAVIDKTKIQAIRQVPDKTANIKTTGIVTTESDGRNSFYMQDETGGILVFQPNTKTKVKPGDMITVNTGLKDTYNGEVEIMQAEFEVTGSTETPLPILIEANELLDKQGMLVSVKEANVSQVTASKFLASTQSGSFEVFLGKYSINLPELREKDIVTITGISSIFNGNAQLYPRTTGDITIVSSGFTDAERVAADKAALTIGDGSGILKEDVVLPTVGVNGSTISWVSDQPAIVSPDGKVSRPKKGDPDAIVTITATLQKGESTDSKNFTITVPAETVTDLEAVEEVKNSLSLTYNGTDGLLSLPSKGVHDTTISWTLQNPAHSTVIDLPSGTINRAAITVPTQVTLIANVVRNEAKSEKGFTITIQPLGDIPTVQPVTAKDTSVKGSARAGADVFVRTGPDLLGNGRADTTTGAFEVPIPAQLAGTVLEIIANDDVTGYRSEPVYVLVKESVGAPSIVTIDPVNIKVTKGSAYTLPAKVTATMSDGSKQQVNVSWTPDTVDTSIVGVYQYEGTVAGYSSNVRLTLEVTEAAVALTVAQALALPAGTVVTVEAYVQDVEANPQFPGYGIYLADQPGADSTNGMIIKFTNADRGGAFAKGNAAGKKIRITGTLHDKAYFSKKGIATYTSIELIP
ncbi:immunoglobulin-like domain-containing protein [Brevibacillus daliensis]|uniref:immunoglobulin-like domain-containing protein n=1 Tax=Brevibacillus daliensis TaxID=2892995 RepID=UPI001E445C1E|nr:immunoglobulin-like domain-containing protein [Brevibacillus daliensis]